MGAGGVGDAESGGEEDIDDPYMNYDVDVMRFRDPGWRSSEWMRHVVQCVCSGRVEI